MLKYVCTNYAVIVLIWNLGQNLFDRPIPNPIQMRRGNGGGVLGKLDAVNLSVLTRLYGSAQRPVTTTDIESAIDLRWNQR